MPLLEADLWLNPPTLLSSALHFNFFLLCHCCPIMQASFSLSHLKKISAFHLDCFCSYYSCFLLLLMKFLNTARISSLFCERPHSVQFSVHCSPTQVLAEFQIQSAISSLFTLSIRHLWHVVWGPDLFPECFCSATISALSGSHWNLSLACVCRSFAQIYVQNSTATTAPVAVCTVCTCARD